MVILAIDYGSKRVGLARATSEAKLASPLKTIQNSEQLLSEITEVAKTEAAEQLVVGLPRGLEGQETAQTGLVRAFSKQLAEYTGLPVALQDEALTSHEAEKQLKEGKKGDVDSLAAAITLDDYLSNL